MLQAIISLYSPLHSVTLATISPLFRATLSDKSQYEPIIPLYTYCRKLVAAQYSPLHSVTLASNSPILLTALCETK